MMWVAELSNGETVYQDDSNGSHWIKLGKTFPTIVDLYLKSGLMEVRPLLKNANAYFFVNQAISVMSSDNTMHFYLIGYRYESIIIIQRWKVPELIFINYEFRNLEEVDPACLIGQKE
jgi:hypothetical protein